jgi:hypothetical protein
MMRQVGLTTVPAAAHGAELTFHCVLGVMSRQGLPDPTNKTGEAPPALYLARGFRRPDCPSTG